MRRIRQRLRAIEPRRAALLLAVVALAAAAMYFGGREAGVGRPTEAGTAVAQEQTAEPAQQGDGGEASQEPAAKPLTLTLTNSQRLCTVERAEREIHASHVTRGDGTSEEVHEFGAWTGVPTVMVTWQVAGGTPPYTLVIDGETRDATGAYEGPSGLADVSCALENGETFFSDRWGTIQRWHRTKPLVDAGRKTIDATVTDSAGSIASASIEIYSVLEVHGGNTILKAGNIYRVRGHLMTIPLGADMIAGGLERTECVGEGCEDTFDIYAESDDGHIISVGIGLRTGTERGDRFHWLPGSEVMLADDDPRNAGGAAEHPLHAKFDELVESIGQPPNVDRP